MQTESGLQARPSLMYCDSQSKQHKPIVSFSLTLLSYLVQQEACCWIGGHLTEP
ncbi:hypothetical protein IT781_19560 [Methylobacter sp. BlB1]|nr:hypothetical protein [Methylobacter sp. BlB1]